MQLSDHGGAEGVILGAQTDQTGTVVLGRERNPRDHAPLAQPEAG